MASKADKERQKQIIEKCQAILSELLRDDDNKYCVDCDAKGPRWAAWNLGIFLCIRCAGIHRNLGVHISKVKSVNLDSWTPEQVACLQQMGNSRGRAVYEANLPDNFRRPQTDSSLEAFIRAKYEQKKYIAREWVPPPMPKPAFDYDGDKKKIKADKKSSRQSKGGAIDILPPGKGTTTSRPKSESSPAPIEVIPASKNDSKHANNGFTSAAVDLLGLDEPAAGLAAKGNVVADEDPFGGFLGANISSSGEMPQQHNNSESQNSLFLQSVSDDGQKKQLTKESILSLYNNSPSLQQQQPVMGVPGGMYPGQPSGQFVGMPTVQSAPIIGPQCAMQIGAHMGRNVAGVPGAVGSMQPPEIMGTNPFLASVPYTGVGGVYTNTVPHPGVNQLHQQMTSLSLGAQGFPGISPFAQPVAPVNVAGMNWNGQQAGHTLSTNLWQ